MAKVTRIKYNSKKFNKIFGENRPFMEPPKIVHSEEKREYIKSIYSQYLPVGIYR